ncbi:MAG: FeoB-associated Cys-rich membrane protein [Clostridia bacterium]|nr:FeoB-associated Cys-rich membrane protein [Clostridia bacterium]
MWATIITIVIIALIVGGASFYIIRAKKKGKKCIGCPYSDACSKKDCNGEKKA